MKAAFVELPDCLEPTSESWARFADAVRAAAPDLLVMNEMPFGPWISEEPDFDEAAAEASIEAHHAGLTALEALGVPYVVGSQPVRAEGGYLNEGFLLDRGAYRTAHHKYYLPEEPGFFEASWFGRRTRRFEPVRAGGLAIGFMICTDLMFNEWARHYRRSGANVIVAPRATEPYHARWMTAASMAAIVSGCYVISSNRSGPGRGAVQFGGKGFAFAPDGALLAETDAEHPVGCVELDLELVGRQQHEYPCYVEE
ncbi:MAG: carbon-nitrogen hydrolase family protein [Planctomycetota bacterium]